MEKKREEAKIAFQQRVAEVCACTHAREVKKMHIFCPVTFASLSYIFFFFLIACAGLCGCREFFFFFPGFIAGVAGWRCCLALLLGVVVWLCGRGACV